MTISTKRTNHYLKALAALAATVAVAAGLVLVSATTPAHASTTYTVNVLHSAVLVNPENPIQAKFAEHPFPDSSNTVPGY